MALSTLISRWRQWQLRGETCLDSLAAANFFDHYDKGGLIIRAVKMAKIKKFIKKINFCNLYLLYKPFKYISYDSKFVVYKMAVKYLFLVQFLHTWSLWKAQTLLHLMVVFNTLSNVNFSHKNGMRGNAPIFS